MNELKQAQAELAATLQDHSRMAEKNCEYGESVAEGRKIIGLFKAELESTERQLVKSQSTPAAVQAIEKKLRESEEKLQSFERLQSYCKEELLNIDKAIVTARQALANARYQFCTGEKQRIAAELNSNQDLKKLMIAAFAANASNNLRYTANFKMFINELIEDVPATELAAAKTEFLKKHNLAD